jgi:hypothetical protein
MNRNSASRQRARDAARDLIETLDLSAEERGLVLGMAMERYESARLTVEGMGLSAGCLSAIFAAALEYGETLAGE